MKMEILLEPTSNKLMVGTPDDWCSKFPMSQDFISHDAHTDDKLKDIMKASSTCFKDLRYSDIEVFLEVYEAVIVKRISRKMQLLRLFIVNKSKKV
ncbi:hypothetical protein Tco_0232129 [Tanacetum coccineum]